MRKLLSAILALYLAAGVLPVQILAEETEEPAEEQSEVIEEAEEVTEEDIEEVVEEELPAEETAVPEETEIPEVTEEPVIEETEVPEVTEEPVQTEEPAEEVIPETEEPVIEEVIPETEEITVPEETAVPEVTEEPVIEEVIPEPAEEVIPETAEPEEVIEEPVEEHTEAPAAEEVVPETEEPVIEEESGEEAEVFETQYKVTFYANGGSFPDGTTKYVEKEDAGDSIYIVSVDVPSKDGYMFYGWYTSKDFKADTRVGTWLNVTQDMSVYACYKPYYTVTLNTNGKGSVSVDALDIGGEDVSGSVVKIKVVKGLNIFPNSVYVFINEPDSYSFLGWYLDKTCSPGKKVNDDYVPTSDITLYAKWQNRQYVDITFHGNGGTYEGSETYTDDFDAYSPMYFVPEFKYSGKVLEGWYLDAGLTEKIADIYAFYPAYAGKSVEPLDLYAKWTTPVKVTLNANGGKIGSSETKSYNVKKGQSITATVPDPSRSGYLFAGWYTDKKYTEKIDIFMYPFTASTTLYAKWVQSVKVTFNGNDKVLFYDHRDEDDDYGLKKTEYLVAKGYTFSDSAREFGIYQMIDGTRHSSDFMPDCLTKGNYELVCWCSDSAATKPFGFDTQKITGNITLYPKTVKYSQTNYTVTFDPNGGMINHHTKNTYTVYKGEYLEYSLAIITAPAGKRLIGYTTVKNDESTLIKPINSDTRLGCYTNYKITGDLTVYAYYVPEYKVTLESLSGGYFRDEEDLSSTSTSEIRYVAKGETITDIYPRSADTTGTICSNEDGKIFMGWYSDAACKNLVTHKLDQYAIKKDQVLYAKWGKPLKAGWKKTNGKWWYQLEDGSWYNEGLQKIGKKYYFFQSNGYILTGWKQVGKNWYYFNTGGDAAIGWKKIGKVWYYFSAEGVMQKSWKKISGKWYYFKPSGAMVTGWQKIGGKWYWFESGGAMKTGWKKLSGKWYWFDSNGVMFANGTKKIGGKNYKFNSSGVCLNP